MARKERSRITINILSNNKVEIGGKSDLSDVNFFLIVFLLVLATPSLGASDFARLLLGLTVTKYPPVHFLFSTRGENLEADFSHCHLYGLKSKKNLPYLKIPSPKFFDQRFLATSCPFLMNGVRLVKPLHAK